MKLLSDRFIPHIGAEDSPIIFIGDHPSTNDDTVMQIFSGSTGDLFDMALSVVGLSREEVRIANVLNYQPAKNDFQRANQTWQMEEGRNYLRAYLKNSKHKVIVALGNDAMDFLLGFDGVDKHRGSVYKYDDMFVVPTFHPYSVIQDGTNTPAFLHDLAKALRISKEGWKEPTFNFIVDPSYFDVEALLPTLLSAPRLYCDIETKMSNSYIRCMGFAWSTKDAVCIFNDSGYYGIKSGKNTMGPSFTRVLRILLENDIPKTFHNGMFDTMMLEENGIGVGNWDHDTMLAQHALQPQLPKGLDYCTSMYTDINYYKDDGKESGDRIDRTKLGIYNCKDVIATALVQEAQEKEFNEVSLEMYKFNLKCIPLAKHFSRTGLLVDEERREEIKNRVEKKREQDYMIFMGIQKLMGVEPFKATQHARVKSFLYDTLELPVKTKRDGSITADEDAVVSHMGTVQKKLQDLKTESGRQPWELKMASLKLLLRIRGNEKLLSSYINISLSPDGRARSWYKSTGTETLRWSAGSWYDESGLNGQTIPRESV